MVSVKLTREGQIPQWFLGLKWGGKFPPGISELQSFRRGRVWDRPREQRNFKKTQVETIMEKKKKNPRSVFDMKGFQNWKGEISVIWGKQGCLPYSDHLSCNPAELTGLRGMLWSFRWEMASVTCGFWRGDVKSKAARWKGGQVFPWGEALGPGRILFSFPSALGKIHFLSLSGLHSGQSPCRGLAIALGHC